VTVRHAVTDMESQVTVTVMSNAKIIDLRRAVMTSLGETKLTEVKIVRKAGKSFASMDNDEQIGERREFLSMGRKLTPKDGAPVPQSSTAAASLPAVPAAPAAAVHPPSPDEAPQSPNDEAKLMITALDDDSTQEMTLPVKTTIKELKAKLCEQVLRGPASKVAICIYNAVFDRAEQELKDTDKIEAVSVKDRLNMRVNGITLGPPVLVDVKVTHAAEGHSAVVSVEDTCTILQLRVAVAEKLGCSKTDVRIVKKLSAGWQSIQDADRLNGRRELNCLGKALEKPPPAATAPIPQAAPKELDITITVDRALGFTMPLKVQEGITIGQLKQIAADQDPTGQAKPEDWDVGISPKTEGAKPVALPAHVVVTEEHINLDIIQK